MSDLSRVKDTATLLLGADQIPNLGFGASEATSKRDGEWITRTQTRVFVLGCGCQTATSDSVGLSCVVCQQVLQVQGVAPERAYWLSVSCKAHSGKCEFRYPVCGVGLCSEHSGSLMGRYYCITHFSVMAHGEVEALELSEGNSFLVRASRLIKGFFAS